MKKVLWVLLAATVVVVGAGRAVERRTTEKPDDMKPVNLTKADFLAKVADFEKSPDVWKYLGDRPAIIDFYADWCGPCRSIAPVLEELAAEWGGKLHVYKVNVDAEQALAAAFGVRSIPTLLFVPMEGPPQKAQGALPKSAFEQVIRDVLVKE